MQADCGAHSHSCRPAERLELLHLLCCDRLEAKRPMLTKCPDAAGDQGANATGTAAAAGMSDAAERLVDDDDDAVGGAGGLGDGAADGDVDREGSNTTVPASWRPKPLVVDSKGRRYWHFREAKGLQTCLFRSSRSVPLIGCRRRCLASACRLRPVCVCVCVCVFVCVP